MRVDGGFLAERRPGERGLAHLLEHVAFHSPTRAAPDQLDRFRHVGMPLTLPEPAGGTTTWRESDYFVVFRTRAPADLDALLGLFREVASDLTLRADAVDAQRAEVGREMADKRLGNAVHARYIAAVAPGSPTDVIDAQNSDDVPTASVATIRALYHRLYRPENTTLVVVGDVDADAVAALVATRFGDWRGVGPAVPRPVPTFRPERVAPTSRSDLRGGRSTAVVTLAAPLPPPPPTRAGQAEATLMDMLAVRAATARLARTRPDHPPGRFGAFIENGELDHRLVMLWDDFAPGSWRDAAAGLDRTACALRTAGLTDAEWTDAEVQLLRELEARAADMRRAPNFALAKDLADALTLGRELLPPNELLRVARAFLPTIDARAANGWWRRQWEAGVEHLRVESPDLGPADGPRRAPCPLTASAPAAPPPSPAPAR